MQEKSNRFAMVVIVECDNAALAHESTLSQMTTVANDEHQLVYVGEPCPVPTADYYDTDELRLGAGGATVILAPDESNGADDR